MWIAFRKWQIDIAEKYLLKKRISRYSPHPHVFDNVHNSKIVP
jgi:hypothetical protein